MVSTWDTLITEGTVSPAVPDGSATFPGAAAKRWLDVIAATITVEIRLRLKRSDDTNNPGRR